MTEKIHVPMLGPDANARPSREIYALMGADNIYKMFSDFYVELEQSTIRAMFAKDMEAASQKSADFFIFLFGGPPIYQEKYGAPRMRARHFPFPIDMAARQKWLDCFEATLVDAEEKYNFPLEHMPMFLKFLHNFSLWMVNKE